MANTEIDSLSLEIAIKGLNDQDIKNLESLANSIAKLQRHLKNLEVNKLQQIDIPQKLSGISGVDVDLKPINIDADGKIEQLKLDLYEIVDATKDFDIIFQDAGNATEKVYSKITEVENGVNKVKAELVTVNNTVGKLHGKTAEQKKEIDKTNNKLKDTKKQVSAIEKQVKRIKTISFVKLIRGAIQMFIRGMQDGIKNLASFDDKFNETMSSLMTAKTQAFNSLTMIAEPLITSITPAIEALSKGLSVVANNMSAVLASVRGMSTYTKINADYMEDYAKSSEKANKFSFDTFETLNDSGNSNMFETAELDESQISGFEEISNIVANIKFMFEDVKSVLSDIGKLFKDLISSNLGNISKIFEQLKSATSTISNLFGKTNFNKLLETISKKLLPSIIKLAGVIVNLVNEIFDILSPLIDVIIEDLLPAVLSLVSDIITPIAILLKEIAPIITTIVKLVVEILAPVIKAISPLIETLGSMVGRIAELIATYIVPLVNGIPDALNGVLTLLKPILKIVEQLFVFVEQVWKFWDSLLHGDWGAMFDSMAKVLRSIGSLIVKIFTGILDMIINNFIGMINMLIANSAIKTIVGWFGGTWEGITWRSNLTESIPSFANGGIVGELWQMNEYGNPEMLYNANGSSNTSVITQEQLARAFEEAIFNTGILGAIEESKAVYIDGKQVAQSKGFKAELNRTNPNLNIR